MKKRTLSLLLAVACALSLSGCGGAPAPDAQTSAPAGSVVEADKNGLAIACGDGRLLRVLELQGEGGKRMAAADYLRGHPVPLGL